MHRRTLIAFFAVVQIAAASRGCPVQSGLAASSRASAVKSCIFDHLTLRTPAGTCRPRAKKYPATVRGRSERAIYDSSLIFGVPYATLLQIARCESALNPSARYEGHYGLFQFLPQTFHHGAAELQHDTGLVAHTYWDPRDAAYVAGYLFAVGHAWDWTCVGELLPHS